MNECNVLTWLKLKAFSIIAMSIIENRLHYSKENIFKEKYTSVIFDVE